MPKVQHRSSPLDLSQQVEAAKWSKRDCLYLPLCFINIFTTEWPMPLMSSPLAATSVATRTRMRPCFKPFKAWSRALWSCTKGTFEFSPCPIQFRTKTTLAFGCVLNLQLSWVAISNPGIHNTHVHTYVSYVLYSYSISICAPMHAPCVCHVTVYAKKT